jgi:hypothetical protein
MVRIRSDSVRIELKTWDPPNLRRLILLIKHLRCPKQLVQAMAQVFSFWRVICICTAEETNTPPIIPENNRVDAVLLGSSPSEPKSMGPSSHHADNCLPPPLHLLEPLYVFSQRYDIAIRLSRAGTRIFLARSVSDFSTMEDLGPCWLRDLGVQGCHPIGWGKSAVDWSWREYYWIARTWSTGMGGL